MGYSFGRSSNKELETCHEDLQKIYRLAIRRTRIDFGISYGYRSPEEQFELYKIGRHEKDDGTWEKIGNTVTNRDGTIRISAHNTSPSNAVDIYIYHPNPEIRKKLQYDIPSLSYVMGLIISCTQELLEKGEISSDVIWGGNWNKNGIILKDQKFDDLPHIERVIIDK